jgi:hypothetical protein
LWTREREKGEFWVWNSKEVGYFFVTSFSNISKLSELGSCRRTLSYLVLLSFSQYKGTEVEQLLAIFTVFLCIFPSNLLFITLAKLLSERKRVKWLKRQQPLGMGIAGRIC